MCAPAAGDSPGASVHWSHLLVDGAARHWHWSWWCTVGRWLLETGAAAARPWSWSRPGPPRRTHGPAHSHASHHRTASASNPKCNRWRDFHQRISIRSANSWWAAVEVNKNKVRIMKFHHVECRPQTETMRRRNFSNDVRILPQTRQIEIERKIKVFLNRK